MDRPLTIQARKCAYRNLGNVAVLGLGVTGRAVAEYLLPMVGGRVSSLVVFGGKSNEAGLRWASEVSDRYRNAGVEIIFDDEDVAKHIPSDAEGGKFDICIASPGISAFSDFYLNGMGASKALIGEVELAWCESGEDSVWIAVTGTNGKTTTTSLIAHILRSSGLDAKAVGNIGDACITEVARDMCDVRDAAAGVEDPGQDGRQGDLQYDGNDDVQRDGGNACQDAGHGDDACIARKYYVVETSSYQLASVNRFRPDVAVILGITPDHIKWHGTHGHYADSKFNLLSNLGADDVAILDATNDEVRAKVREIKNAVGIRKYRYIPIGTSCGVDGDMREACGSEAAAFCRKALDSMSDGFEAGQSADPACEADSAGNAASASYGIADAAPAPDEGECGRLTVAYKGVEHSLCAVSDLQILGNHNVINALAAASAAVALNVPDEEISKALAAFSPLEHRIEPCGEHSGIRFYNDSKATNVDATLQAIRAFGGRHLTIMLGGDDKGTDLGELVRACGENADVMVCYGQAGARFYDALKPLDGIMVGGCGGNEDAARTHKVFLEKTFDEAFERACNEARSVVLLSPACASFDEFSCFEERGEHFKHLVAML